MAINKKFIHFKKLEQYQRELEAGNILPKSICFCADAKTIFLNGTEFSTNTLYRLSELLDSGTELTAEDNLDEAIVKLYNSIQEIVPNVQDLLKQSTETTNIIKLLVSEISDLEQNLSKEIADNAEITAAALTDLNRQVEYLRENGKVQILTQEQFDALDKKDPETLYLVS